MDLAASHGTLESLASLEGATNQRLEAEQRGLEGMDPRELVFGRSGYTFINAAFTHTRPGGNRFNDEGRGAWYCAFEPETGLAEVTFHLRRELANIGRFENTTDYAELLADFIGPFHDLRGKEFADAPFLAADTAIGYKAGQELARTLRADESNGAIWPSVRHAAGTCLAAFRPDLVQNLRQGGIWRLAWEGSPEPTVTQIA
jgi:hypothetical protein